MGRVAIYPGSFDPPTNGHIDIVRRAARLYDQVIVAVAYNAHKAPLFSPEERLQMLKESVTDIEGVQVESFDGLVIEYARSKGVNVLIRGLRMISDFEYEFQMALTNRHLDREIETVFLMPSENYSYISSTLLKEACALGADLTPFLPSSVEVRLRERIQKQA